MPAEGITATGAFYLFYWGCLLAALLIVWRLDAVTARSLVGRRAAAQCNPLAALGRARQLVLVGDSGRAGAGLVDDWAGTLPAVVLPTDRGEREEHIAGFLAGHGYEGVVDSVPARPTPSSPRSSGVSPGRRPRSPGSPTGPTDCCSDAPRPRSPPSCHPDKPST